jgi:hypothetical protein
MTPVLPFALSAGGFMETEVPEKVKYGARLKNLKRS